METHFNNWKKAFFGIHHLFYFYELLQIIDNRINIVTYAFKVIIFRLKSVKLGHLVLKKTHKNWGHSVSKKLKNRLVTSNVSILFEFGRSVIFLILFAHWTFIRRINFMRFERNSIAWSVLGKLFKSRSAFVALTGAPRRYCER